MGKNRKRNKESSKVKLPPIVVTRDYDGIAIQQILHINVKDLPQNPLVKGSVLKNELEHEAVVLSVLDDDRVVLSHLTSKHFSVKKGDVIKFKYINKSVAENCC